MECARDRPERSEHVQSSTSVGAHFHGQSLVNRAKRRTCFSRCSIVVIDSWRLDCCRAQPSSMASNTASSGRRCANPSGSTR